MDRWLTVLQKVTATATPQPPASTNVESAFRDLVKVNDDGDGVDVPLAGAIYDGDTPTADIHDPVSAAFEKAKQVKFGIPEFAPPHEDGTFFEKRAAATWSYTYQGGVLVKSACDDPELPGGHLDFDEHGNEMNLTKRSLTEAGRHDATARFASPSGELAGIYAAWEELLGSAAYPEKTRALWWESPEVSADPKKKTAGSEAYSVGGQVLAKSELTSRMYKLFEQIRGICEGQEARLLEKSIKALDLTAFAELAEPIVARMRRATELIRS
jgi:hypothetical protein